MKYRLLGFVGIVLGLTVCTLSCKKDEEKAAPIISNIELGIENSNSVKQGERIPIKAEISAEAGIHSVTIDIYADMDGEASGSAWSYSKTHDEFDKMSTLLFSDSILVEEIAATGKYILKITVIDYDVKSALDTEKFDVTKADPKFTSINGFVISENGTKYIGTNNGLFMLDETTGIYSEVNNGLQITSINTLALSPEVVNEELWIGSEDGALNFSTQSIINTSNSDIHNDDVSHLSFDIDYRVFFGTPAGVSIKDGENWVLNAGKVEQFLEYDITGIGTATNYYTYVATRGKGVERFKYNVDGISGATIFDKDWTRLETDTINCVYVFDTVQAYGTPQGVAMHYSHLTKWDWENYYESDGLIDNNVISIVKDANDVLWFGTEHGLSSLNNDIWTSYSKENNNLLSNNIMYLAADKDGSVWFANDDGLCRFMDNTWTSFPK